MAISRPILLALVGALLALGAFYATSGARNSGDEAQPGPAVEPKPAPKSPAKDSAAKSSPKAPAASADADAARPASRPDAKRTPAKPASKPTAAPTGMPADVSRALAGKRTVVLFFFQRGAADDEATARAVASIRGRRGVQVFSAPIARLADYRAVTAGVGVSQAPAIVILRPGGGARLIEGFVDPESLAQQVADARR